MNRDFVTRNAYTVTTSRSTLKTIVISAAPKFTNGLRCITSLYDVIEDVYERPRRHDRHYDCGEVYYDSDIRPIIDSVHLMSWTNLKANEGHGTFHVDFLMLMKPLNTPPQKAHIKLTVFHTTFCLMLTKNIIHFDNRSSLVSDYPTK